MFARSRKLLIATIVFVALQLISWTPTIMSLPQGAPETVCDTMLPFHAGGIPPKETVPPFRIETSTDVVGQGQTMRVDIVGVPAGLTFGGFMIQARNRNPPYQIIGQFNPARDGRAKLMNCENSVNNSATHSNAGPKPEISLEWQSPVDFLGQVIFNSTVAQSYDSFWVGVPSNPVQVVRRDATPTDLSDNFYTGCGSSKTCFGYPIGCLKDRSCQMISAVTVRDEIYEFELKSGANSPAYIALGLSEDDKMGDDLVIECIPQNGVVSMYSSYTSGAPNYGTTRSGVPQNTARLLQSSVIDGVIYCKVQRDVVTNVQGRMFDLKNQNYHLLLASGSSIKENGVGYHDIGRTPSALTDFNTAITRQPGFGSTRQPYIPQAEPASTTPRPADPFYSGCGRSKTCFGFPNGCLKDRSCQMISAVTVRGDIYEFELKSGPNSPAYIALGLSEDDKMGDDLIIECIPQNGRVNMYSSYTSGPPNYGTTRSGVPQNTARLLQSSVIDGVIYCKVQRDVVTNVQGRMFDLINQKYHLLLASGSSIKDNGVGYHDIGRIPSGSPINLAVVQDLSGSSTLLLRLHGAFMVFAWIGTTSLGILLARYFKQTWVGSQTCGKDQWFAWHRICMVTTWSLTIAAFIIIFVEIGAWSAERNPHAILGLITTFICFIQPIGAMFRPAPNSKNRPFFNWAHWLGGNLAHILAIVTIFFAVKLTKAELPEWTDWILVAFVVFHVIVHLIYSIAGCSSDRQHTQRVNTFQMGDIGTHHHRNGMKMERKMDAPYAGFRKGLLGLYTVVLVFFVVVLILIVVLAPIEQTFKSFQSKLNE